jgi:hypothetical protein
MQFQECPMAGLRRATQRVGQLLFGTPREAL